MTYDERYFCYVLKHTRASIAVAAPEKSFSVCVDRFARPNIAEAHAYCCGVLSGVTNQFRQPQKSSGGVDGNVAGLNIQ